MKKAIAIFFAVAAIFSKSNSQNIYYDALNLKRWAVMPAPSLPIDSLANILSNYMPDSLVDVSDEFKTINNFKDLRNPFFTPYFNIGAPLFPIPFAQTLNSIRSSVGGLNVSNFADGAAKFLIKRFKEELTVTFFQKFKDEISKVEELRTLFPETYKVLLVIDKDIYKFSVYLNTLRESFIKDLTNLYTDFKKLTELEKYKKYFLVDHPEAYTVTISSFYFIDQFSRGQHPGKVIDQYNLENLKFSNAALQHNVRSSVSLLQAFSTSFKSLSNDHYWVPADSLRNLLKEDVGRDIYFGLMYQKYGKVSFYRTSSADSVRFDTLLSQAKRISNTLPEYKSFIETISEHAEEVNESLSVLKEKKKENIDYNDYYKFYNASLDLFEYGLTFIDLPFISLNDSVEYLIKTQSTKWISVARNTGELYIDVRTKNYSSAILNVTSILDTVLVKYNNKEYVDNINSQLLSLQASLKTKVNNSTDHTSFYSHKVEKAARKFGKDDIATPSEIHQWLNQKHVRDQDVILYVDSVISKTRQLKAADKHIKLKSTILKYGSFAASVAQAQNSDEVEAAIESIALPVGSASIKRNSEWNIALNGYLGGFYGNEYLKESPGEKRAPITGVYAPIGVAFSHNLGKAGAASIFLSVIDIGAFASFRLGDDTTKALPEVSLKNIFAPGVGLIYGIPKIPVSVGWSWQLGPMLRELDRQNEDINLNASNSPNYRWQFFLAVDIPLINFYTKSK